MKTIIIARYKQGADHLGKKMNIPPKDCYSVESLPLPISADIVIIDGVTNHDIDYKVAPMLVERNGIVLGVLRSW